MDSSLMPCAPEAAPETMTAALMRIQGRGPTIGIISLRENHHDEIMFSVENWPRIREAVDLLCKWHNEK